MKILNLTKSNAEIQFSINEIVVIKNSLMETYRMIESIKFKRRIEGLSRKDFFEISKIFNELVESPQKCLAIQRNNFIQVKEITKNYISLDLTYQSALSIRDALFEVCDGMDLKNFEEKIESDKMAVSELRGSIGFDVIQKMREGTPGNLVFNRGIEIEKELNFENKKLASKIPLPVFIRICQLKLKSHILVFRLSSFKNRMTFSKILIAFGGISESFSSFPRSDFQFIRNHSLISLIAYLELTTGSVINNEDLKEDEGLVCYNSDDSICFEIQVLPKNSESEDFRIRLNLPMQYLGLNENSTSIIEFEDFIDINNVFSFISEVRGFLADLLTVGREN